jgi:hypothetical protein
LLNKYKIFRSIFLNFMQYATIVNFNLRSMFRSRAMN